MSRGFGLGWFALPDVQVELDHTAVTPVAETADEIATVNAGNRRIISLGPQRMSHDTLSSGAMILN